MEDKLNEQELNELARNIKEGKIKWVRHYSTEEMLNQLDELKESIVAQAEVEKHLRERLKEAHDEAYASKEMQDMKAELEAARQELYNGFRITDRERKEISEWQKKHDAEVHGLDTDRKRLSAGGAIGGRYSYEFTPTSIGVIGVCKCGRCKGEKIGEFEFQSL